MKLISIIVPIYNEEACITEFLKQLEEVILSLSNYKFEVILIDDGSEDSSLAIIENYSKTKGYVKFISFSRNFGHQLAIEAGLNYTKGTFIIMMDSDLQHPPNLISKLLEEAEKGYDIVNTIRISTEGTSIFKKISSKLFYFIINFLSEVQIQAGSADFRLLSKQAAEVLQSMPERDRFYRGMVNWIGFKKTFIEYVAYKRFSGKPSYNLIKMISLALSCVTSFSSRPLHISFLLGLSILFILFIYLIYATIDYFVFNSSVKGWPSLYVTIFFLGAVQLISIGIIGEYIAKIYYEIKRRPHYIIKKKSKSLENE